jgi:hypothetical protein
MLDLYISCWIFSSIFMVGYLLKIANEQGKIQENLTFELIGHIMVFYFLQFFVWHINLYMLINQKEEFDNEIRRFAKGL